jgi:hypothetical protein
LKNDNKRNNNIYMSTDKNKSENFSTLKWYIFYNSFLMYIILWYWIFI